MHIVIAADRTVSIEEADVFTAFDVQAADTEPAAVLEALGSDGAAAPEDDHVFVTVDGVRRLAEWSLGGLDPDWEAGFAAMVEFAATKGWMNADRSAIRAHITAPTA